MSAVGFNEIICDNIALETRLTVAGFRIKNVINVWIHKLQTFVFSFVGLNTVNINPLSGLI